MNIEKITSVIINPHYDDKQKESKIIDVLAEDPDCIEMVLRIIAGERRMKDELITDMNLELSRADVHIQEPLLASGIPKGKDAEKRIHAKEFVLNHITAFYVKHKGQITHCFNKQV